MGVGDLDQLDDALTGQDLTATDVVAAIGILLIGTALAYLVGRITRWYVGRPGKQSEQVAKLIALGARWLIQIVAIAWALDTLGVGVAWLTFVVGIVLIVAVFTAKPLLESMAASIVLSTRPAFGVGDDVKIGDDTGEVIEITGRSVVLRPRDGRRVHIPTSDVLGETITVYTVDRARRSDLDLKVTNETDLDAAERAILEALRRAEAVVDDPAPAVRAREINGGVRLSVRFWHGSSIRDGNVALDQAVRAIKPALEQAGIELAVPQLEIENLEQLNG